MSMPQRQRLTMILCLTALALAMAGCVKTPSPTPPPAPPTETQAPPPAALVSTPGTIVISELLPGLPGNNNAEFIELYNAGTEPVDLRGWSLWYRLSETQDLQRVYLWVTRSEVPGYGHYLLVRTGAEFQVLPDGYYDLPLYERKGGLELRNADGDSIDRLGWGDAPLELTESQPAPVPEGGASLERLPGGLEGSFVDNDDNRSDFALRSSPEPQSSGSPLAPLPSQRLILTMTGPMTVTPGTRFTLQVQVTNATQTSVDAARIVVPVPGSFGIELPPVDAELTLAEGPSDTSQVAWTSGALAPDESRAWTIDLRSPWSYGKTYLRGHYVAAEGWPLRSYGELLPLSIEGGAIPISAARSLEGNTVTVEGVATMYTGGFYAGTTGTKFYLQDESAGIQVYCPGAKGLVNVRIGDRVRVTGKIEIYRDSVELVPAVYPDDVEVLAREVSFAVPLEITGAAANSDASVLGLLNTVTGRVARLEEFSYSYELDLETATGEKVLVYIDKESYLDPEFIDVGDLYRVTGISELYDAKWQLKPRVVDDFAQVFPPELMLVLDAANSVGPGELITYTLTAYNHTDLPMTNVKVVISSPLVGGELVSVLDGGNSGLLGTSWVIPELAPDGASASVRFVVRAGSGSQMEIPPAAATSDQWPTPAPTPAWLTFVGSGVPIWAIQGEGNSSPFVRRAVSTEGIVTGVFPELGGFWLSSIERDASSASSEGLFVQSTADDSFVSLGDHVVVTGTVRERSGQTLLALPEVHAISVLSQANPLPAAVELDPPQARDLALSYYESLEGMLVQVTEPAVAVGPMSQYGEYALVRSHWGISRVMKGDPTGLLIYVDDGSDITHLDGSTLPYAVKVGDSVAGVIGPLAYTYDAYKIEPITVPTVISSEAVFPTIAPADADSFSIATFNVENFFDVKDPHPSSPPRPGISEYRLKLSRTAETLVAMGAPAIVGLQEVENIGVLEDLAAEPAIATYGYVPVLLEGLDSRGIDVGYLVRGDVATVEGVSQHPAPEGLTSRPPLLITVTVHLEAGDQTLFLINNHFASMSGGEQATEAQRMAQADWNLALAQEIAATDPDAFVAVLGDLNSFYASPPLDILRAGGLRHVYQFVEPDLPYTYVYQGESETLDHILVTEALYGFVSRVEALHANADFPLVLPDDPLPWRVSDHDPLVVTFEFSGE